MVHSSKGLQKYILVSFKYDKWKGIMCGWINYEILWGIISQIAQELMVFKYQGD